MAKRGSKAFGWWLAVCCCALGWAGTAAAEDDAFVRGYVSAVLELEEGTAAPLLGVQDGVVWLDASAVDGRRRVLEQRIAAVPGVARVEWARRGDPRLTRLRDGDGDRDVAANDLPAVGYGEGTEWLPARSLFEPLSADPRWPRFSASYQHYKDDPELRKIGAVSLGAHLPIVQLPLPLEGRFEVGIQGSTFSIFDLNRSSDLVNTDFFGALPLSLRWGPISLMTRIFHQSSHLGDEYLLRDPVERLDVQFEGVDALLSIDLGSFARIYGGAGSLLRAEPDELKDRSVQAGIELTSPYLLGGTLRPFAALDVKRQRINDWSSDYSGRLGLQIENPRIFRGRRLQLYAEYFNGFSPNGQFFSRRIEYFGGGLNFFF